MTVGKATSHHEKDKEFMDRIDMITGISKTGKLIEMDMDPFTRAPESKAVATQTEGSGTKLVARQDPSQAKVLQMILPNKDVVKSSHSPASHVLRLVVGMLGMEVHEQPSSWAESWLSFEDKTYASLGLGSKKRPVRKTSEFSGETPAEWQMSVLESLREMTTNTTVAAQGHDWGPDFPEHLDLAEFALYRITHAVKVLQDPEQHDRPLLLREYTEEMVMTVCKDLRQWLEQLGTILSIYHVHLLDLEAERRKLAQLVQTQQEQIKTGDEQRQAAVRRHDFLKEQWEEEKMKRNAERLLGISAAGGDAKIYSQNEVDEMYRRWEKEHLEPLLQELSELRIAREELHAKMRNKDRHVRDVREVVREQPQVSADFTLSKANVNLLMGILGAVNERTYEKNLNKCLSSLAEDLQHGGHNLAAILADVKKINVMDEAEYLKMMNERFGSKQQTQAAPAATAIDQSVLKLLDVLTKECQDLEAELRKSGADKLRPLVGWMQESVGAVSTALKAKSPSNLKWAHPPKWELGSVGKKKSSTRSIHVNTTDDLLAGLMGDGSSAAVEQLTADYEARMRELRRQLEAKIKEAWDEAERERLNAQEALERLAEESAKADATLAELRRRIAMLEALLREKGLGKQAADAMWGAGLSEFVHGRDVFERLYRDALDRMRRHAERQKRFFEETSLDFLRTIGTIMDPHIKLPGLDMQILSRDRSPSGESVGKRSAGAAARSRSPPRFAERRSDVSESMDEPLNIARLSTPFAASTVPAFGTGGERPKTDSVSRRHASALALRPSTSTAMPLQGRSQPDTTLSIGLGGAPTHATKRPSSQSSVAQVAARSRQPTPVRLSWDLKTLPPLECKGQGQHAARSRSLSNDEAEERMKRGQGLRSGSPMREAFAERQRAAVVMGKDPILSIRSSAPPASMQSPNMSLEQRAPAAVKVGAPRPGTQTGSSSMLPRQNASMPQLGPPRLLVQSVTAAH